MKFAFKSISVTKLITLVQEDELEKLAKEICLVSCWDMKIFFWFKR